MPKSYAVTMKERAEQYWREEIERWDQLPPDRKNSGYAAGLKTHLVEKKRKELRR